MTYEQQLDTQIAEAQKAADDARSAAQSAEQAYSDAIAAGDMPTATQKRTAASEKQAEAGVYADRVAALEAQRPEAQAKDARPAYDKALRAAHKAVKAERADIDKIADAVAKLDEAVADVRDNAKERTQTMKQAMHLADKANVDRPDLGRAELADYADKRTFQRHHELAEVADGQRSAARLIDDMRQHSA